MYRVILFSVALFAGGIAALLAVATPPNAALSAGAQQEVTKVDVLVAVDNLDQGSVLQQTDMQWQSWPVGAVKPFFITRPTQPDAITELTGSIMRSPIYASEFIHAEKIAPAGSGFLSAVLSSGRRAVAVRVSAESSAGGFIRPNDRVDVLHTAPCKSQEACQSGNEVNTILKAVRVLAIDQIGMRDDTETVSVGKTATLELESWQAEAIIGAQASGTLTLVLRPATEAVIETTRQPDVENRAEQKPEELKTEIHVVRVRRAGILETVAFQ